MEAMDIVCKYFRTEHGDARVHALKKRINKAHALNYRLRNKNKLLQEHLNKEVMLRSILNYTLIHLIKKTDSILNSDLDQIEEM